MERIRDRDLKIQMVHNQGCLNDKEGKFLSWTRLLWALLIHEDNLGHEGVGNEF